MKIHKFMIAAALAMCCAAVSPAGLHAGPARRGIVKFVQPDGSTFDGYVRGDEFCHFKTTLSGQIIAQDSEGWWCLASYSADGKLTVSKTRAGSGTPALFSVGKQEYPRPSARRAVFDRNLAERRTSMRRFLSTEDGTATKAGAVAKQKHGIVILAAFSDVIFNYSRQYFVDMLTKPGYSYNDADGSALDYFNSQFGGLVDFSFDVSEIVTLPKNRAYYGSNDEDTGEDKNAEQMVVDACKGAAKLGVDFSKYDDDNDGYVDNVFIFFSGGDEADGAGDDCIWSHAYYIESGQKEITLELNGKRIDSYACTSELTPSLEEYGDGYGVTQVLAGIGTFCHEYSHTFGLPDLYDTDYDGSGGQAEALWHSIGLMDGGNMNNSGNTPPNYNAIDREILGIGPELSLPEGTATLEPVNRAGQYFRVDTDTEGEYFLIECRSENETWDGWIGGSGMIVYHIDKSSNKAGKSDSYGKTLTAEQRWYEYNEVNCRPDRQCADLIEADPAVVKQAYRRGEFSPTDAQTRKVFFPCGSYNTIGPSSGLAALDGNSCGVQIYGIRINADGSVSFSTGVPKEMSASVETSVFQNVAILDIWTANVEGDITVKYGVSGKTLSSEVSVPTAGQDRYMVKLTGLTPKTAYKAEIYASAEDSQVKIGSVSFTTKTANGIHPAISVTAAGRNEDGSFSKDTELPLAVNNAADAKDTEWLFDGKKIEKGKDIFLTVEKTGILKAVLTYSDGTQRCIYKKIVVK